MIACSSVGVPHGGRRPRAVGTLLYLTPLNQLRGKSASLINNLCPPKSAPVAMSKTEQTIRLRLRSARLMSQEQQELPPDHDLQARALAALEEARAVPPGPARREAMKKAGMLRNAAALRGMFFAKPGRPRK